MYDYSPLLNVPKLEKTELLPALNLKTKKGASSNSDSESDDNEQALISAREWRNALKRITVLEAKLAELQQTSTNKRAREDDEETGEKKKARLKY